MKSEKAKKTCLCFTTGKILDRRKCPFHCKGKFDLAIKISKGFKQSSLAFDEYIKTDYIVDLINTFNKDNLYEI